MLSTSLIDNRSFEDTPNYQSTIEDDTTCTHSLEDNHVTLTENPDTKMTENLRLYLEKVCFPETEWTSELLSNASTDRETYQ